MLYNYLIFSYIQLFFVCKGKKKRRIVRKPGSVGILIMLSVIYLSDLPSGKTGQVFFRKSGSAGLFDLATRRMHGCRCHHLHRWALTPPFHPYLITRTRRLFSVALPKPFGLLTFVSAMPCVARTFLCITQLYSDRTTILPLQRYVFLLKKLQFCIFPQKYLTYQSGNNYIYYPNTEC